MVMMRTDNDCLQACLSELLEVPYEEIPAFWELCGLNGKQFWERVDAWLKSKGLFRVVLNASYDSERDAVRLPLLSLPKYRCLGVLEKPGRAHTHSVVLEISEGTCLQYDPKKNSEYDLRDLIQIEIIAPLPGNGRLWC